jgi:hypothetical protein
LPVITLIAGIASVVCSPLALLGGPAAIILGHLTLMKLHEDPAPKGKGLTIAGLSLGYVSLVMLLVVAIVLKLAWPMLMNEPSLEPMP